MTTKLSDMQITNTQKNYSKLTLRLNDPSLHKQFWDFSAEEIWFTMPYFTVIFGFHCVSTFFYFEQISLIIVNVVEFLSYLTVHLLGNKYRRYHVYGMFLLYVVSMSVICIVQIY